MRLTSLLLLCLTVLTAGCESSTDGRAPVPAFTYSCVEFICAFDASDTISTGPTSYIWNFGDDQGGAGELVTHAYGTTGTVTVTLTAISGDGEAATTTQQLSATGNPAAQYYYAVHDAFSVLMLMEETIPSILRTTDTLQSAVEAMGSPLGGSYPISCAEGGSAEIIEWTDTNNSLTIDSNEFLDFRADGCTFSVAADAVTSMGTVRVSGDFDSNAFSIGQTTNAVSRFRVAHMPSWALQGLISVTTTRNGSGEIETLSYEAPGLRTLQLSSSDHVLLSLDTPANISTDFDGTTGITGEFSMESIPQNINYQIEIPQAVDIADVGGNLRFLAGEVALLVRTDRIDISVDADPAYFRIEVDALNDGDIDISTRFPQTPTLERLPE